MDKSLFSPNSKQDVNNVLERFLEDLKNNKQIPPFVYCPKIGYIKIDLTPSIATKE